MANRFVVGLAVGVDEGGLRAVEQVVGGWQAQVFVDDEAGGLLAGVDRVGIVVDSMGWVRLLNYFILFSF